MDIGWQTGKDIRLRVALVTVGCRANQADTAWLSRTLDPKKIQVVPPGEAAHVYVINSCAVTRAAERDVRKAVRRARKTGGAETKILLTGCMVSACPEAIPNLGPLWRVVPTAEGARIPDFLHALVPGHDELNEPDSAMGHRPAPTYPLPALLRRARPSLRVQDGCNQRCAYCAVPAGRGPERSVSIDEVVRRLEVFAGEGIREAVICGVNLGHWGRDFDPPLGVSTLASSLELTARVERIRLSSIEPWAIDERMIDLVGRSGRIAPHLHLPLQSGDDGILARMGRPYRGRDFVEVAQALVSARPGLAVGADVMAGFPGEDEAAFERTVDVLQRAPIAYLHAFGFSPRPKTPAASMAGQVDRQLVRRRVSVLRDLGHAKRLAFATQRVGRIVRPLIEPRPDKSTGYLKGVTEDFLPVLVDGSDRICHRIVEVRVRAVTEDGTLLAQVT